MKLPISNAQLKQNAKYSLDGCYGRAALLMLVYSAVLAIPQAIVNNAAEAGFLFQIVLSGLFWFGVLFMDLGLRYCMLELSRDTIPAVSDLFCGGKFYLKELLLQFILSAVPSIIGFFYGNLVELYILYGLWLETILSTLLVLVGCAVWIVLTFQWFLAPYLLLDNPQMSVLALLRTSRMLMKGNCSKLILLYISLIGWLILSLIPVVTLWVTPLIMVILCCFYNEIIVAYKKTLQQKEETAAPAAEETPAAE